MPVKTVLSNLSNMLSAIRRRRRNDAFVCGDCARNAQCGAEPSPQCVVRAAQMASDRRRPPSRETFIGW